MLVERTPELRVGGHAVDIRGTALEVIERMGLDTEVRDARTQIFTLSAVRPDGARTYDVALRPMHEARGDREIEIMRDDLVRILFGAVSDDVEVVFGDSVRICRSTPSTMCSDCVIGRCSTTNPAAPRPCSPCAATSARKLYCCFAARCSTSISAMPPPNTMCCVGGSPEWVGTLVI